MDAVAVPIEYQHSIIFQRFYAYFLHFFGVKTGTFMPKMSIFGQNGDNLIGISLILRVVLYRHGYSIRNDGYSIQNG